MKEFKLPELGENILSADVLKISIKVGEIIRIDSPVLEIETDKATIEVPSTVEGKIKEILVKDDDKVRVGQVIFTIDEITGASPQAEEDKIVPSVENNFNEQSKSIQKEIIEFNLPDLGESIQSADVLKIPIKIGDNLKVDQTVLEIETDKATIEVPSTVQGRILEIFVKEGDKVSPGQIVLKVNSGNTVQAEEKLIGKVERELSKIEIPKFQERADESKTEIKKISLVDNQPPILINAAPAAPSVRRLARELGVDINKIPGSGINGRISLEDVKSFVKKLNEGKIESAASEPLLKSEPLPDFSKFGEIERQPMNKIRIKTAEHLSHAWRTIPHVTQFDKADATELEKFRKQISPQYEKNGVKLTATSYLVKIITYALKTFPQFNSSIDMEKKEIVYKKFINIGVAVDTENGLIVPVIKNADKKSLLEISKEISELAEKARKRKILLDELQGGSFSISNLGGIGGTYFTPIVNSPEVAILGVSKSFYEPIYKDGSLVPRLMLPLSLSYDHRVIDGADGIRFLRWIIEAIENPLKIF
jgi:pyruvate dehydrogenase E2 component (dihydrolipoamide acetyltransferase)